MRRAETFRGRSVSLAAYAAAVRGAISAERLPLSPPEWVAAAIMLGVDPGRDLVRLGWVAGFSPLECAEWCAEGHRLAVAARNCAGLVV